MPVEIHKFALQKFISKAKQGYEIINIPDISEVAQRHRESQDEEAQMPTHEVQVKPPLQGESGTIGSTIRSLL